MHYYFVTKKIGMCRHGKSLWGFKTRVDNHGIAAAAHLLKKMEGLKIFLICQNCFPIGKRQWGACWAIQGTWSWWSMPWDSKNQIIFFLCYQGLMTPIIPQNNIYQWNFTPLHAEWISQARYDAWYLLQGLNLLLCTWYLQNNVGCQCSI